MNANLLFKWLRDPRFCPGDDDVDRFLPVEVMPERVVPEIGSHASGGTIEITLCSGHRLNISGAFDPDAIARLVRGLVR